MIGNLEKVLKTVRRLRMHGVGYSAKPVDAKQFGEYLNRT